MTETIPRRPWLNHLPAWIHGDPAYATLGAAARHVLQVIANRCDSPTAKGGNESLLGCFGGEDLVGECGCSRSSFCEHVGHLTKLGFVTILSRGGGRNASVYGVPGQKGELDPFRAPIHSKPLRWSKVASDRIRQELRATATALCNAHNSMAAAPRLIGTRPESGRVPSQNRTLPSSSSIPMPLPHKPSPTEPISARLSRFGFDNDEEIPREGVSVGSEARGADSVRPGMAVGPDHAADGGIDDEQAAHDLLKGLPGYGGGNMSRAAAYLIASCREAWEVIPSWIKASKNATNRAGYVVACYRQWRQSSWERERTKARMHEKAKRIPQEEADLYVKRLSDERLHELLLLVVSSNRSGTEFITGMERPEDIREKEMLVSNRIRMEIYRQALIVGFCERPSSVSIIPFPASSCELGGL